MAVTPPATFHTQRLLLRPVTLDDAEAIFTAYAQDPEVTRYVIWSPHRHLGDTREFLQRCLDRREAGTEFTWAICLPDGTLIGTFALRIDGHKANTGYGIARPALGARLRHRGAPGGGRLGAPAAADLPRLGDVRLRKPWLCPCDGEGGHDIRRHPAPLDIYILRPALPRATACAIRS